jgi:hypothetical protein
MTIHHLLQDPVRAAIYRRGLADGSQSLTKILQQRAAPKTEAQQPQNRRKLQTFEEKRKAGEPSVSQQYPYRQEYYAYEPSSDPTI